MSVFQGVGIWFQGVGIHAYKGVIPWFQGVGMGHSMV